MEFLIIGLAAGTLAGLFGIGGGIIIVPAFLIAAGIFLGAWLGAALALKLPAKELQRGFALFLCLVAIHLWITAR